jgi:DNA-binding beta-propeller fold protein YncE
LQKPPALATGLSLTDLVLDTKTKTLYASSQNSNSFWALDASSCNATNTAGCTKFAPTTPTGFGTLGIAANPNTKTTYVTNFRDNTVSVINGTVCNEANITGCNQSWPTIAVGKQPRFVGINKATNTIYVSNFKDGTLSLINAATCTGSVHAGCLQLATSAVGNNPLQIAVDEATNTIFVGNASDGTVSVVNGAHCQSADTTGCNPTTGWPTVTVGNSPQGLGFNPVDHTLYVANIGDNTVSVINGNVCNGTNTSGCVAVATVPVGNGPRSIGIVTATNTVFVGNQDDLTVSLIDGATCNGANTSGCDQTPPAILVGAFPNALFNGSNILGRNIAVDQKKQIVFIPVVGDSDVARLDGQTCRAGHVDACTVTIVPQRMGAFTVTAAIDDSSGTVYVGNDDDSTVSLFRSQ